ncbi:MAG TPA: hypothetical protein VL986_01600, partial [Terracidiphilus sp.]|nr:hypothetical protein [Terracidiphilus sp.]
MKRVLLLLPSFFIVASFSCVAQSSASPIDTLKNSYAASGSIVVLDKNTIVIEPKMPAPVCALPKTENGKTTWQFYSFPLASITVPLNEVDETLISEDRVFTGDDPDKTYKPGDSGDTTMIVIAGKVGRQFQTLIYDREKFLELGPGPHSGKDYDQSPDNTEAFGLTFSDQASAHAFEMALREAVLDAKARARTEHP